MKKNSLLYYVVLFFAFHFSAIAWSASIPNDDCMACHGEKGLEGKRPDGKTISLFFDHDSFNKSIHANLQCVSCHDIKELPHEGPLKKASCSGCHVKSHKENQRSAHSAKAGANQICSGCHEYHTVQKASSLTDSVCGTCHKTPYSEYKAGVHAAKKGGQKDTATCFDCHGRGHGMLKNRDPRSPVHASNLPRTCSGCHENPEIVKKYNIPVGNAYSQYMDSIHGKTIVASGHPVAANCSNCHGAHGIKRASDKTSRVYPANIPATCGACHKDVAKAFETSIHGRELKRGNKKAPDCTGCHPAHHVQEVKTTSWKLEAIRECGNCHSKLLETYRHTYHGKITNLGFTRVAKCIDCHGSHDILPKSDPHSRISKGHLLETCRSCHPGANKNFSQFIVHADYKDRKSSPTLYYVWIFMTVLLIGVFGFFTVHTILWLPRSWIERIREWRRGKRS
ncbi:MAG: hypothetical protein C0392_14705 [Syntrophus sp. (in: bacteria)]|nr:hypothetical protein [Syntrophus sp. (in: bacteria)]